MLSHQYGAYEILPGLFVQGDRTLGENIADLGGLAVALDAYDISLRGEAPPVLDGFTGEHRVFLGWAQIWRTKVTEGGMRRWIATRPHSPHRFRVNGVVRNLERWYTAFDISPADELYLPPAERVRIW